MQLADAVALGLIVVAAVMVSVACSGFFKDVASRAGWDLEIRRAAESALVVGEGLAKQVDLVQKKEVAVSQVVDVLRSGNLNEQSSPEVARALERIDAIDQEAVKIRARVEARREPIERECAEQIEKRRATAQVAIMWRSATLASAVAGAALLGLWLA